ncbi:hypothetical protein ACGF3K_14270 [Streptomyces sp. NPDC047980]|uniref:hypothetical protein n=1 Tax=Streptomyces sp. NPDC047980 TaxID=3365494 RepID=UPI00371B9415
MNDYSQAKARFERDTAGHQMTVLHDDGLYRHLKFMNPEHGSFGSFQLITWPYNLVVKAGWTFHFDIDATPDMFDLFRRTSFSGEINPGYWQEKVRAGRDEVEGFEPDLMKAEIASTLAQWMRDDLDNRVTRKAKELGFTQEELKTKPGIRKELARQVRQEWRAANRELREAVHEHFFSEMTEYNIEYESEARRALHDFSFRPEGDTRTWPYYFADWHEWRMTDYSPGFLHCCYAIRHGIDLYIAARKAVAA